ncbi:MAG: cyclic pyranopterin monophosphate synthase MoaC [Gammaproteobacteria bacterium]
MSKLTHLDDKGHARMVDVGEKKATNRQATASGQIFMTSETLQLIVAGDNKKGDALSVARIAGIMAAKQASTLIPLCHPLLLTKVAVELKIDQESSSVSCLATVQTKGQTGVEMEALTAVNVALLTVYDMCKANDKGMVISDIKLLTKSGGKSGEWHRGLNE